MSSRRARLTAAAALALVVGVPASLGATGLAAKVVGSSDTTPTAAEYPSSKVTICHHTHSQTNPFVTITVSQNALPAHMGHGDTVGACSSAPPAAPVAPAAAAHTLKKAHKAKHNAGKRGLHGHGKPAKTVRVKTHGKSGETHGAPTTGSTTVHGKSHAATHGQGKSHQTTHGKGEANGKSQTRGHGQGGQGHGQGQSQTHGQGQGNGQGQGQQQGQGGTHGNGGGSGKGH
ncbi:MAG TPA: hypothetical protein VLD16_09640 [Gaiellaceae bacterium]|nr:hypothetical protein [Gaiellaceae bacterium]